MAREKINGISFGKKLKSSRENLGMTQYALAEEIEVSTNFIGQIERGERLPSLETAIKLANKLSISLDSILSDSLTYNLAETEEIYLTDRQRSIVNSIIKTIKDNF